MTKNEWIRGEIGLWVGSGLIDADLASKLEARYPVSDKRVSLGTVLVGAFGALLVGLGVIALFAANWDEFGREARAVISVTPVVLCALGSLWAAKQGTKSAAVWEPLGILWAISIGAATSLVAQTYQVGGTVPGLVLLVAMLTLPITWVVPSATVTALWPIYPVVWTCLQCQELDFRNCGHPGMLVCGVGLMALSIPGYVAHLKRCKEHKPLPQVQFVTGLVYSVGLATIIMRTMDFKYYHPDPYVYTLWACAAFVGGIGRVFRLPVWPWVATLVAALSAFTFGVESDPGNYIISLLLAVGIIGYGIRAFRLSYVNVGAILAIWLILSKFFASNVSFTVKGVVMVVCGVALTAANVVFIRLKKSGRDSK